MGHTETRLSSNNGGQHMAVSHASTEETLSFLPPAMPSRPRTVHVRGRVRRLPSRRRLPLWRRVLGYLWKPFTRERVRDRRRVVLLEGIERDPAVFGGAARIAGTKIPIFFIEEIYIHEGGIDAVLAAYPRLSAADVFAAMAYCQVYPAAVRRDRRRYKEATARP